MSEWVINEQSKTRMKEQGEGGKKYTTFLLAVVKQYRISVTFYNKIIGLLDASVCLMLRSSSGLSESQV